MCRVQFMRGLLPHGVAFEHAPVSRATLELLERTAFAALTPHISALRSLSAGVLPEALPEPQEIHIPSPVPSHAEDFLPLMEEYFQKTHFTVLAKHAPDETGACYLYEFLAAHRRWKLHVTLNDEKTFFILRLFPGRNALVFDPRYLHAAAQICNAENDSVKSGALFVGRRPEGLCAKMALSALEVPTSLEETLYSAVSILVSLLYSREAELQKAAAGVIFPTGLDAEKLKSSASDRKKRLEDAQRFLAMTARPKPLDPASAEKEFDALFGGDIAETDDDDPNRSDKEALMPDYYIAEDGTIHDREAEHRSRTQHTAAPPLPIPPPKTPPKSALRANSFTGFSRFPLPSLLLFACFMRCRQRSPRPHTSIFWRTTYSSSCLSTPKRSLSP